MLEYLKFWIAKEELSPLLLIIACAGVYFIYASIRIGINKLKGKSDA